MQKQKNELITQTDNQRSQLFSQTDNQRSPGLARPEDFEIVHPDEAATKHIPGHGQCGDSKQEYKRLLAEREKGRPKGKTSSEIRNQKELMREHGGSKQVGE